MRKSRSEFVKLADVTVHVRRWGNPGAPKLFLLHGWLDSSATFQFLVDALNEDWDIIAPDWRGCGRSDWQHSPYWLLQYVADLERLLAFYSENDPARIVGHSLGGNVAGIFASIRPQRVSHLAILDAYGTGEYEPANLTMRLDRWLQEQVSEVRPRKAYTSVTDFARKLMANNPRLTQDQADFLATEFSIHAADGSVIPALDPYQRLKPPPQFDAEDFKRLWKSITAPVLLLIANESFLLKQFSIAPHELDERIGAFSHINVHRVDDAGHNLHHDQPEQVAQRLEAFMAPN